MRDYPMLDTIRTRLDTVRDLLMQYAHDTHQPHWATPPRFLWGVALDGFTLGRESLDYAIEAHARAHDLPPLGYQPIPDVDDKTLCLAWMERAYAYLDHHAPSYTPDRHRDFDAIAERIRALCTTAHL